MAVVGSLQSVAYLLSHIATKILYQNLTNVIPKSAPLLMQTQ